MRSLRNPDEHANSNTGSFSLGMRQKVFHGLFQFKDKISDPLRFIPFLLECISQFKWLVCGQMFFASLRAIDLSLRPYLLKIMLDKLPGLKTTQAFDILFLPAFFYIVIACASEIILRFEDYIWLHLNSGLKCLIAEKLMDKILDRSYTFFQNNFSGNLANKIKDVMSGVPDLSQFLVSMVFGHLLALLIGIYTILQADVIFAFIMVPWILVYLIGTFLLSSKAKYLSLKAAEIRNHVVGYISDVLSNILNVWLFNGKTWERKNKLFQLLRQYTKGDQERDWFFIKMYSFQSITFILYQIICLYWLIAGFKNQTITPGDFALVLTLNISIVNCLSGLSADIGSSAELIGNVMQGLHATYSPIEIQDTSGAANLIIHRGEINFKQVYFIHAGCLANPLFQNLCLRISPGEKVGLVGYSGSGKSTFVNLILRLFDITSGNILIDGQDIRDVTLSSLRDSFALIPQDPALFHRTLLENIRYGRHNATEAEVIAASKLAHIDEFIQTLPDGYHTLVGERGVKLSGGQKQRIAIARAILKNAPILILDEATSHLDSITEGFVQESLLTLMKNKTTIVIAHRLSTLLNMDRIIVFDKGKIIEDGTHSILLKRGELYKTMWETQVGGFLPTHQSNKEI